MFRRIEVRLGFPAVICLLAWLHGRLCLWFLAAMACHECGHLIALRLCGVPIHGLSLRASGAVIHSGCCGHRQAWICAAAGPVCSFLLAAVVCRAAPGLAIVSGLLGSVNLLPLYPLDGGRILRAILSLRWEEERVHRFLARTAFVVCALLMLGACWVTVEKQAGLWPIFAALVILSRAGDASREEHENPVAFLHGTG